MVAKPKACAQTEARRRMGCGSTRLGRFAHSDLGESLGTAPPGRNALNGHRGKRTCLMAGEKLLVGTVWGSDGFFKPSLMVEVTLKWINSNKSGFRSTVGRGITKQGETSDGSNQQRRLT